MRSSTALNPSDATRRKWLAAVTGADDGWIVGLLEGRPDLLLAAPHDVTALAEAVISPAHINLTYESADRTTRQVLEALCILPETTSVDALAAVLGTPASSLSDVVERFVSLGLVLREGEKLARNPGLRTAIEHPAGLGRPVREVLAGQTVAVLSDRARLLEVESKGTKATLVETIASVLSSPEKVRGLVAAGPDGTSEIAGAMSREYLELNLGYGSYQASQSDRTPEGYLLRRGLLVSTSWGAATMPAEVALALRGGKIFDLFEASAPRLSTSPTNAEQVEQRANEAALRLVGDVAALLEAWGTEPAKLLQAGGLGIREVRRAAKLTSRSEIEAARLAELAGFAGLADTDEDILLPTTDYDRWSDLTVGARWALLASAWYEMTLHLSLAGASDQKGKPIPPLLPRPEEPEALGRRMLVLNLMSDISAGQSVDRASLHARALWQAPTIWRGGPARPELLTSWIWEEAELVGITAGGAMSSLGRHLIAGDVAAAAGAVRAPAIATKVVLQADLTAVVAGDPAPELRRELDLLADIESAGAATVYRFSELSLRRGFDAGRTGEQILAFLDERASKGVPQPLTYLVQDLARRFGQVRVGRAGCYVRSSDTALLAEVVQARKTAHLALQLLAPGVAVSASGSDKVAQALRDAGYLAAQEDGAGALVFRRPPARRITSHNDDLDEEDMADRSWGPGGKLLSELFGGEPPDLGALVQNLRHGSLKHPDRTRDETSALAGEHRLGDPLRLDLLELEPERPTHIARDPTSIRKLLEQAWDEEWLVRLSYVSSQGEESEFYAEVTELSRRVLRVRRLPKGNSLQLQPYRISWARVATEVEEEMQLS